jgi:hypothetical protein
MPRTDVPPPGQGKRSQRKAWREKADEAIAVYDLTADETPESLATEEATSQALPYWDDEVPQPQSQQHTFTREEAQELIEMAYQEGWQQGMEDGYKLGKDKESKEYYKVVQGRDTEAKRQADKAKDTSKDSQYNSTSWKTNLDTNFSTPAVEIAEIDQQAAPGGTKRSVSATIATMHL